MRRSSQFAILLAAVFMVTTLGACRTVKKMVVPEPKEVPPDSRRARESQEQALDLTSVRTGYALLGVDTRQVDYLGGLFPRSMASGDINGDGLDDVVLGASYTGSFTGVPSGTGGVYVIYGNKAIMRRRDMASQADLIISGRRQSEGYALALGDLNGDGLDDLAIGAPFADGFVTFRKNKEGLVYVFLGRKNLVGNMEINRDADIIISGAETLDYSGASLAIADLNGDGLGELIIGVPVSSASLDWGRRLSGTTYVLKGRKSFSPRVDLKETADVVIYGAQGGERTGTSMAVGDFNGDGRADLMLGAPNGSPEVNGVVRKGAGAAYILFGQVQMPKDIDLRRDANVRFIGSENGDGGAYSVAFGDINGDGFDDAVIGAPAARHLNVIRRDLFDDIQGISDHDPMGQVAFRRGASGGAEGETYVIFGGKDVTGVFDLRRQSHITLYGARYEEDFSGDVNLIGSGEDSGIAVATGDINGDGIDDVLIGAPFGGAQVTATERVGRVYVFYGAKGLAGTFGLSKHADFVLYGHRTGDRTGAAIATGDVNGDGKDDILVAAPRSPNLMGEGVAGRAYLVYSH